MELVSKELTYEVVGLCMSVHRELGHGFLESVYKDAIQFEFAEAGIDYSREKEYCIGYKGVILSHRFYADFVIGNELILEVKAVENGICTANIAQTINYLKVSGCKIGLIVNFGRKSLEYKRLIF
jgi:GxxExxY protein